VIHKRIELVYHHQVRKYDAWHGHDILSVFAAGFLSPAHTWPKLATTTPKQSPAIPARKSKTCENGKTLIGNIVDVMRQRRAMVISGSWRNVLVTQQSRSALWHQFFGDGSHPAMPAVCTARSAIVTS
jgi:hypothetical protein